MRTLTQETPKQLHQEITLAGWAASTRDHGGLIFIDLRDHTGVVQLTIDPGNEAAFNLAQTIRDEFVIRATGSVVERRPELVNPNIATGTIEIRVSELEILNPSKPLPFPITH